MTLEAIQQEVTKLSHNDRMALIDYLQEFEDDLRLRESIEDFENGRTVSADTVIKELRERASMP